MGVVNTIAFLTERLTFSKLTLTEFEKSEVQRCCRSGIFNLRFFSLHYVNLNIRSLCLKQYDMAYISSFALEPVRLTPRSSPSANRVSSGKHFVMSGENRSVSFFAKPLYASF